MYAFPKQEIIKRFAYLRSHATGYEIIFTRKIEYKTIWDEPREVVISSRTYQVRHPDDMRRFYGLSSRLHSGVPYIDIRLDKLVNFEDWNRARIHSISPR